jgi:DNA-binding PadR family transcriptional regulator
MVIHVVEVHEPKAKINSLSPDFIVFALIWKAQKEKEDLYFNRIKKSLNGIVSGVTISKSLDRLFDLGLLNAKWTKVDGKRWGRVYTVTGEGSGLAKKIHDFVQDELPDIE